MFRYRDIQATEHLAKKFESLASLGNIPAAPIEQESQVIGKENGDLKRKV